MQLNRCLLGKNTSFPRFPCGSIPASRSKAYALLNALDLAGRKRGRSPVQCGPFVGFADAPPAKKLRSSMEDGWMVRTGRWRAALGVSRRQEGAMGLKGSADLYGRRPPRPTRSSPGAWRTSWRRVDPRWTSTGRPCNTGASKERRLACCDGPTRGLSNPAQEHPAGALPASLDGRAGRRPLAFWPALSANHD